MFTGIIEELGKVAAIDKGSESAVLRIDGPLVSSDAALGSSIAVNGVCLTVTGVADGVFSVDVMAETLNRSSLGQLDVGSPVNLERAMAANARLGGHIVQGHVDGTGVITARTPGENWEVVEFEVDADLARYLVDKGSVAINGVSLTVIEPRGTRFTVSLIPTTLEETDLGDAPVGAVVNIETDILGKYVVNYLDSLSIQNGR